MRSIQYEVPLWLKTKPQRVLLTHHPHEQAERRHHTIENDSHYHWGRDPADEITKTQPELVRPMEKSRTCEADR